MINQLKSVSVVVPVFNESEVLSTLVERLQNSLQTISIPYELIFVDDGSSDESAKIISEYARNSSQIRAVILNRNYGQHSAIMAGFAEAKGDLVITIDADLQNPPEEIPRLVDKAQEGFDVVGTVRRDRKDSWFRRQASALVNYTARKATGIKMHDYGCMLRAYRHHIVEAMLQCSEHSTFIPILANSFARKVVEIEVDHAAREVGESKYSIWKLINLQFDLLTSMTALPLRLLSVVGVLMAATGFLFGLLLLTLRIVLGATWAGNGVFTLFALLFVFVGAQFVGMGLLGEYLGRIYNDVRNRPKFFVEKIVGKGLAVEKDIRIINQ